MAESTSDLRIVHATSGDTRLAVHETRADSRLSVILLHGLTLTGELVLMGSRKLERNGFRVLACDARGHGASGAPVDRTAYSYREMAGDVIAIMDALCVESCLLVGASMGFHTALRVAIDHPDRVAGVVGITPGFDPEGTPTVKDLHDADLTAALLRRNGIEGFVQALEAIGDPLGIIAADEMRSRISRHRDLSALADAVECVIRSRPFESLDDLVAIEIPALLVASRDDFDPRHPFHVAAAYAAALPSAELCCEAAGRAPIAWSRRRLGDLVLDFARALD